MEDIEIGWKEAIGILVITLLISDFVILIYDMASQLCGDKWYTAGIFSHMLKQECDVVDDDAHCPDDCKRGWMDYKTGKTNCLCSSEIKKYGDSKVSDKVGGFHPTQLLAYVIVPFMTAIGIIYALVFTRPSYAEWIFWILLATLIYTGLTSISYSTDVDIIPEQQVRPLNYIINKFGMQGSDELRYSFIARKQDGKECFIEGTMLGGGTHPENLPPTYSGDCTSENIPL